MVSISARRWDQVEDVLVPVGMAMAPVGFGLGFLTDKAGFPSAFPVWMTLVCVGSLAFFLGRVSVLSYLAGRKERGAGYTTIPLPHDPDVDLVERKTGVVIREAGAPPLTKGEYEAAVRRMRAQSVV